MQTLDIIVLNQLPLAIGFFGSSFVTIFLLSLIKGTKEGRVGIDPMTH